MSIIKNDLAVATEPMKLLLMITRQAIAIINSAKQRINIFDNLKKEQLRKYYCKFNSIIPSFNYFSVFVENVSLNW